LISDVASEASEFIESTTGYEKIAQLVAESGLVSFSKTGVSGLAQTSDARVERKA
jgi:hypothetical protein